MKKVIFIVLVVSMLLSLNSCEWVNTTVLGNPSKKEIIKKMTEQKAREDSLIRVAEDCARNLAALQSQQPAISSNRGSSGSTAVSGTDSDQRYHIIVGCFLMEENADRMMSTLRSFGLYPIEFRFVDGYACISAKSFNSLNDAYNAMTDMLRDSDYCPDDVWVYDIHQNLHQ